MLNVFESAERFESLGQLDRAIAEYRRIADAGVGGAEPLHRMGLLLRERGELATALDVLEQASAADPGDPYPELRLAQAATALGRNMAAVTHTLRALDRATEQQRAELLVNLSASYHRLKWLDLAWATVRPLPTPLPDWWARARVSAESDYARERAEAVAMLRGRRSAPDPIVMRWELANRLFWLGRLRAARRLAQGLIDQIPDSFPQCDLFARILAREEGADAGVAYLRSVPRHRDHPEYPVALAGLLHEAGRPEEVLAALAGRDAATAREDERALVANALYMLGRVAELRAWCRDWVAASPMTVLPSGFQVSLPWDGVPDPLVAGAAAPAMAEPVRVVQFWDKADVPADVAEVMNSWRRHHPHAEHIVFDEPGALAFLRDRLGAQAADTFERCHHAAMKADFFRCAFLLAAGGNWVDADELCLQPMDGILRTGARLAAVAPLSGEVPGYLHNLFLASRAGSPVMQTAVAEMTREIGRAVARGDKPDIWQVTGPGLITRAVAAYLAERGDAGRADVGLLWLQQFHRYARTEGNLSYKRDGAANWQLAGHG